MLIIRLAIDMLEFLQRECWLYYSAKPDHTREGLPAQILVRTQSFCSDSVMKNGPMLRVGSEPVR